MGAAIFLFFVTLLVGATGFPVYRRYPRLGRYMMALPVAVGAWLVGATMVPELLTPSAQDIFIGAVAGGAGTVAAPRAAWWFGVVPVALMYGFGTVAGTVIWRNDGVPGIVLFQCVSAFFAGLAVEATRHIVARRGSPFGVWRRRDQ